MLIQKWSVLFFFFFSNKRHESQVQPVSHMEINRTLGLKQNSSYDCSYNFSVSLLHYIPGLNMSSNYLTHNATLHPNILFILARIHFWACIQWTDQRQSMTFYCHYTMNKRNVGKFLFQKPVLFTVKSMFGQCRPRPMISQRVGRSIT